MAVRGAVVVGVGVLLAVVVGLVGGGDEEDVRGDLSAALVRLSDLPEGWSVSRLDDDPLEQTGCSGEVFVPVREARVGYQVGPTGPFVVHSVAMYEDGAHVYSELSSDPETCGTGVDPAVEILEWDDDAGFGDESTRVVQQSDSFNGFIRASSVVERRGEVISVLVFFSVEGPLVSEDVREWVAGLADGRLADVAE